MPTSTTTTLVDNNNNDNNNQHSDKTGLWDLVALLGLGGLAGLRRRRDTDVNAAPAAHRGRGI